MEIYSSAAEETLSGDTRWAKVVLCVHTYRNAYRRSCCTVRTCTCFLTKDPQRPMLQHSIQAAILFAKKAEG